MPGLRATLTGSANRCSGRSLAATAPGEAHIASSTGSTRAVELYTSSTLTTARTFTTAPKGDFPVGSGPPWVRKIGLHQA
jgi:hypothetical protein